MSDPVNLSIGQPDFAVPELMQQGAIKAIKENQSGYVLNQGIAPLRAELMAQAERDCGRKLENFDALVTSGVTAGFQLAYMAILDPGDEVLIPDPRFPMYEQLAKLINATTVSYSLYPDFQLTVDRIAPHISSRTKLLVLNTPSNPAGIVTPAAEIDKIIELCRANGIWIIYDEIYSLFAYDTPHYFALGSYDRLIAISGFAKSHGAPGWRLGYVLASKEAVEQMIKVQQFTFVCAPSVLQYGAVEGLKCDLTPYKEEYRRRRDFLVKELSGKFEFHRPDGAFYLFPKAPGGNATEFVERCIAKNVAVIPGSAFSAQDTHFRISYATPMERLERAVERLNSL